MQHRYKPLARDEAKGLPIFHIRWITYTKHFSMGTLRLRSSKRCLNSNLEAPVTGRQTSIWHASARATLCFMFSPQRTGGPSSKTYFMSGVLFISSSPSGCLICGPSVTFSFFHLSVIYFDFQRHSNPILQHFKISRLPVIVYHLTMMITINLNVAC